MQPVVRTSLPDMTGRDVCSTGMHNFLDNREIAEKKKRLVELDNLEQYYKFQIKKLENAIKTIRKEIEKIGVYD